MNKEECIKKIEKCISYLESFGYQWALEQAKELKQVVDFVKATAERKNNGRRDNK